MKKRLAVLIAAAMLVTSMPFFAFAGDEEPAANGGEPIVSEEGGETGETGGTVIFNDWNEDHTVYYDENGNALTGVVKEIDGKMYFFSSAGVLDMSDGWKTAADGTYYVSSGSIVTSPIRIAGSTTVTKKTKIYYNKKKKKWQTKKIKKAKTKYKITNSTVNTNYLYMFGTDGKLIKTTGLYTYNGSEYYGLGGGVLQTGWAAIGNNAMYFYPNNGSMAKGTKVGYLNVPANGRLGQAYAMGVRQLNKSGWDLKKAYKFSYKIKYQGRWYRAKDSETYAIKGFSKNKGNCYVMAATFYIQAKLLGYDVHQVEGKVGIWPHSWTVIMQDGKEWIYDPNFKNETRRNGWKIWYGKKRTWKYSKYHKMN